MNEQATRRGLDLGLTLAIGCLGLALRLAYVGEFADHPLGRLPWIDEGAYWSRAREIGAGRWLPARPFYQDPLLPYVLSGLARVVGPEVAQVRLALACLGALTPIAVFWAGRLGLGRAEGLLAGLAAAVYGPLIFSDGLLDKEGLGALVAALALGLTAGVASGRARPLGLALAGLTWGILTLLRANALVIGPLGAAWAASLPLNVNVGSTEGDLGPATARKRRTIRALSFAAGFASALVPATVVNALVGRPPELLLTTWQMGANFYIGNGPGATGTYEAPPFVEANPSREAKDFMAEARRRSGRPLTPGQVSQFWFNAGLTQWRDAPAASISLLLHKFGLIVHDFEIPDNQDAEFVRLIAAPALGLGFLSFGWIAPWAAVGLGRSDRSPFWWFLVLTSAAGLASTAAFFVVGRYRVPWMPGIFLLGAAGLVDTIGLVRRGAWRGLAGRALLLVPAAFLAWRPLPDPAPERWGHMLIVLAVAELGADHLEPAIDALDDARAFGAGPAGRVNQLLAQGPLRSAMQRLIATERSKEPAESPAAHPGTTVELRHARWLRQFPESRSESLRMLDEFIRSGVDLPSTHRERGAWWLGRPDDPEARAQAAQDLAFAVRGSKQDTLAAILLALLHKDRRLLPRPGRSLATPTSTRLRFAHAILSH